MEDRDTSVLVRMAYSQYPLPFINKTLLSPLMDNQPEVHGIEVTCQIRWLLARVPLYTSPSTM